MTMKRYGPGSPVITDDSDRTATALHQVATTHSGGLNVDDAATADGGSAFVCAGPGSSRNRTVSHGSSQS